MKFVRQHIKHVIYIVKENRTFDQILGDLGNGSNGANGLTQFGEAITPNFHRIANQFVTLDNFMDPGDGSMDGWSWSLQGRVTNTETITQQINYAFVNRGLSYESEGANRGVPVNLATVADRDAAAGPAGTTNYSAATAALPGGTANLLTGTGNHASSDAPFGEQGGYIFSAVLQAGGTVRDYGFLVNNIGSIGTIDAPVSDPFGAGMIAGCAARPVARDDDRRLLPRLRQQLSRCLALQRVEARVRPVRGPGEPAEPVDGAVEPRSHGQLRLGAGGREHARDAAGRQRPRRRPPGPGRVREPLRRRHARHRHRGRLPGRARPRRFAPRHGVLRRPLREEGRRRQQSIQPGQRCSAPSRTSSVRSTST